MCAPVCAGVRQGLHVCAPFACTPPSIHLASPPSCTPCTCTALQAAPSARSEEQAFVCVHAVPHITLTTRPPPARSTPGGSARSEEQALAQAHKLGYPVMIRPSFVLGGRAMEILYNDADMKRCVRRACCARVAVLCAFSRAC